MSLGLRRQKNAPYRTHWRGFCGIVARLQQKRRSQANLMRPREIRAAAVLPTRPSRPVRTLTVTPARPANAHARGARRANHAVMALKPRHTKEKAPDRAGALVSPNPSLDQYFAIVG